MKKTFFDSQGFTLVELLIVIALIAILSVAVLATINPIEQTNKARDAQYKNDAAEVLSAFERYYASKNEYPWGIPSSVGATILPSNNASFGVIDANSDPNGTLISTSELKSSFGGKAPFTANIGSSSPNMMYVFNNGTDSNYVCFVPIARANRSKYGDLRCLGPASIANAKLGQPLDGTCSNIAEDSLSWNSQSTYLNDSVAYFMCVPETETVAGAGPAAPAASPTP